MQDCERPSSIGASSSKQQRSYLGSSTDAVDSDLLQLKKLNGVQKEAIRALEIDRDQALAQVSQSSISLFH
jgi:hypothetical protein